MLFHKLQNVNRKAGIPKTYTALPPRCGGTTVNNQKPPVVLYTAMQFVTLLQTQMKINDRVLFRTSSGSRGA
jgi:hypothetical protein